MRGKAAKHSDPPHHKRITPAYAGKSYCPGSVRDELRDHPRLCGEKLLNRVFFLFRVGSPPPMRGKVDNVRKKAYNNRITPAYAGKSSTNE